MKHLESLKNNYTEELFVTLKRYEKWYKRKGLNEASNRLAIAKELDYSYEYLEYLLGICEKMRSCPDLNLGFTNSKLDGTIGDFIKAFPLYDELIKKFKRVKYKGNIENLINAKRYIHTNAESIVINRKLLTDIVILKAQLSAIYLEEIELKN